MLKKAKLYSLLAIIVASTVVGLFGVPQTARAQNTPVVYVNPEMKDDIVTKSWREAMLSCLSTTYRNPSTNSVTYKDLRDGDWFGNDEDKNVGFLIEPTDGRYECNEQGFVAGFIRHFGWINAFTAACNLGYGRPGASFDTQACLDSGEEARDDWVYAYKRDSVSKDDSVSFSASAIDTRASYNHNSGNFNDAELYIIYLETIRIGCATNPNTPLLTKPTVGGPEYVSVMVDDGRGNMSTVYYEVESRDANRYTHRSNIDGSGSNQQKTCAQIAAEISDENSPYVLAYSEFVEDLNLTDAQINAGTGNVSSGGLPTSTCQVEGIGWLVCPLFTFLANVTDATYNILESFLQLQPVNMDINDSQNGTYRAWKIMRDFANTVFVAAFLLIVFSQITNIGISNYGLKRLLPKLVASAVLVNISYFICAIAVDLSNLLGAELKILLDGIAERVLPPGGETAFNSGSTFSTIVTSALMVGIGVAVLGSSIVTLPLIGAAILFILPIIVTIVIVMILRQAAVILLIFIAPLAFVALLLPSTESYFQRWQQLFKTVLLLYPLVALTFGAGALASAVLMAGARDYDDLNTLHGIAAAAVRILPLVLIPTLMKIASSAFGRITGVVNDKQKGWFDNMRNTRMENHRYDQARAVEARGGNADRIRALDRFTPYGANIRARRRKDRVSETESILQGSYLEAAEGQAARNAAQNAQKGVQNAEINAETVRLESSEGIRLETDSMAAEAGKQVAATNAQTEAINALATSDPALLGRSKDAEARKKQAEESSASVAIRNASAATAAAAKTAENMKEADEANFESRMAPLVSGASRTAAMEATARKQAAEDTETAAATENVDHGILGDAKNAELLKQRAENDAKTAGIENADIDTKIRTTTSKERLAVAEGRDEQAYEETIGGLAPAGTSFGAAVDARSVREDKKVTTAATDSARVVSDEEFAERVLTSPTLAADMGGIDPNGIERQRASAAATQSKAHRDIVNNHLALLEHDRVSGNTSLTNVLSGTLTVEQEEANTINVVKNGSDTDITTLLNHAGALPTGDPRKIAILEQYAANIGNRNNPAIGSTEFEQIRNGEWSGNVADSWLGRARTGSLNATKAAAMSTDHLDEQFTAFDDELTIASLSGRPPDPALYAQLEAYARSLKEYRQDLRIKQPETKITERMDNLIRLIDPAYTPPTR